MPPFSLQPSHLTQMLPQKKIPSLTPTLNSGILTSQQGNFALFFALTLVFVLSIFAYVLDTGFFIREKNRYQAMAETAAMAAINQVCFLGSMEALENMVTDLVRESGLDLEEDEISVETGFYDALDQYEAFEPFTDFIARSTDGYPDHETWNAVRVTMGDRVKGLTGFQGDKTVRGSAVAYLPRVSLVSARRFIVQNGSDLVSFDNGNMYVKDRTIIRNAKIGKNVQIQDKNSPGHLPESKLIENHLIPLDTLIAKLKSRADKTYTLADRGKEAFYEYLAEDDFALFDFTKARKAHSMVYLDLPETTKVCLAPNPDKVRTGHPERTPFGRTMNRLTVVAKNHIWIYPCQEMTDLGGSSLDQVSIVSSRDIKLLTGQLSYAGVTLICTRFSMEFKENRSRISPQYLRIITYESDVNLYRNDIDEPFDIHFTFGPPCPPVLPPALGVLEGS